MSIAHFDALPTISLQLAVQVDRYRRAIHAVATGTGEVAASKASKAASVALRSAGVLAFAIPALWTPWGDMVVRHSKFMAEWLQRGAPEDLRRAWRHLEDRAEIVTQRCVDWALRQPSGHPVANEVSQRFLAWDEIRREAFGLARQIDAMREMGSSHAVDEAVPHLLRERHEEALRESARLLQEAATLLHAAQSDTASPPVSPDRHRSFEELHDQWKTADEAAAAAEFAIFEMEVQGLAVSSAQRERAAELRASARALRQAILDTGLL